MAKRSAEEQITREGFNLSEDNNEDSHNNTAPPDIMARRKILKPKGRSFQFQTKSTMAPDVTNGALASSDNKAEKFKALANKFLSSIEKIKSDQVIPDYRPIAQKYLKYYQEIECSDNVSKTSNFGLSQPIENDKKENIPKSVNTNPFANVSTFSIFSFGSSKTSKKPDSDSDSESEIEIKGPSFTFNKEIKDPVFKLSAGNEGAVVSFTTDDKATKNQTLGGFSTQIPASEKSQNGSQDGSIHSSVAKFSTPVESTINSNETQSTSTEDKAQEKSSNQEKESSNQEQISTLPGEDKESVLFQVKAKLMLLKKDNAANPYQSLGVGELKVLKSEEGSSPRVLIRAEGGLRILLNALLIKDVEYSVLGNGSFVRFPALDERHQIVTYVIKVGSSENGNKLCKVLNSAKVY
ncbi:hypothetical protein JCM33374_g187 [Metschnikowia sp. JCM 33374]|nr:hypothetical protein JCM33374_g187 [Metschnikowia sp. JCM 33374]